MMKTRRKSKVAAAAVAEEQEAGSSQATEENHPATILNIAIPADIDIDSLSNILPEASLTSPSPDAIVSLYRLLLSQVAEADASQRELDAMRAESDRKDVELDQALQDRESLSKELEVSLESAHNELNQVKQERDGLATSQTALQAQIIALTNSQSSSSTETDTLKHRLEDIEREKRDLVGVISRLKQENSQRDEEIQTLRANLKETRQDHQVLEGQIRELRSTETSTKFKVDSLTQQLQLSQSETARTASELTSKTEEFAKYRRVKHAELVQLQSSYDTLTQTHAATESTLKALQSAHTAQTHQLTQALGRVQDLTGQLAEQEATYTSEASGLRRLVGMMEEREKQAKEIVEGIEVEWARVGDRAERRETALKDDVDRERRAKEQAQKRVEQLEAVLDRMDRGELPIPGRPAPAVPRTPVRTPGTPDILTEGMMGLSPTVAMVSKSQRGGKTFTEVYADYVRLQEEFGKKNAEYDHMDRTLSAVLAQIEERAPILSQQRTEYERVQSEAAQLASQLAQALSERDAQASLAQESSQKLDKNVRENELLQKQLEDLGRQVQTLLKELGRRDDPTIPSDEDLEQMLPPPAENIEAVITNNLVLFRSVGGLQEQNQKLLKIVRELGAKMEAEEKDYREAMDMEQGEAVKEAHEAIQELAEQLERQKKSSDATIQAYMKERDALRSMLARAERPTIGMAAPGAIPNGEVNGYHEGDSTTLAKELADIQNQFHTYRTEMGVDSVRLREETIMAQREVGQLSATLAKANAKIEYLNDRHRMIQEEFALQARDLDSLKKRNQQLDDQYIRVDIARNHASEDLVAAKGQIEQLRNECANLRAEKKIWESVQSRLIEENRILAVERSHLSDLMGNVQKMHNDLERSGENDRRRLESQMQMLEGQTQDLRVQLSQERDSVRHISLQKDIELKELQNRLDKNLQGLSQTRESLVGAETSKKHLEERVEDLTRQLQGNEEKLAVYERRSSRVNGVTQHADQGLSREQQLETEVAELRSTLKVTEVDLATARSHMQQFQEISQANESALTALNATHDEYKASTEAQISRHESDYQALQENLQSAQEELTLVTNTHHQFQEMLETERMAWAMDKKTLEDTIVDMTTSEKHSESNRSLCEGEVRQQEERAKAAEGRYSQEVVAHAESIKAMNALKKDLATARATARDSSAAAETAKAKLATSEGSWKQQKDALVKEVADLSARCKDLASHNNLLHQHLEDVSSQAARIRQAADSSASAEHTEGETGDDVDVKLSELRSVVAYLRKEKEIVDLQLELSKQENARLKTQIDHLSQNLQDSRATLAEERERAVETATSEAQHVELIERINQLNILRESNATLRSDCESHARRSRELETKLRVLSAELDPAKEQVHVAQGELVARDVQLKRLEEENRRWQERNTQLLSKYDRIDPTEMQGLKDEIEQLKSEKEKAVVEHAELVKSQVERIEALEASVRNHRESHSKNTQAFKQRLGQLNTERSKLTAEAAEHLDQIKALTTERDALLNAPMADTSQETLVQLETLRREKLALQKSLEEEKAAKAQVPTEQSSEQTSTIAALREERDKLLAEKASWASTLSTAGATIDLTLDDPKQQWDVEKAELMKARDEATTQAKAASEQARKAVEEAKNIRFSNEKFQAKIQDLQKARAADSERAVAQQETAIKAAVDKFKAGLPASDTTATSVPVDVAKRHAEELQTLEERLTTKHQAELGAAVESARTTTEKEKPVVGAISEADLRAAIAAAIEEHEKQLQTRHTEDISSAVERGRMEQAAKGKLKDSQLVKAQKKVKELEIQILEWRKAGILPESSSAPPPATPVAVGPSITNPSPTASAPSASNGSVTTTNLPRKPSLVLPTGPADAAGRNARGAPRARGQRGGFNIRGAAPARGGAPIAPPTAPTAPSASGVQIAGAAAKRSREEGETPDDSLAKRLKPAEGGGTGKPVALRRPPPT